MKPYEHFLKRCDPSEFLDFYTQTGDVSLLQFVLSKDSINKLRIYKILKEAGYGFNVPGYTPAIPKPPKESKKSEKPLTIFNNPNVKWGEIAKHIKENPGTKNSQKRNPVRHTYYKRMLNWLKENPYVEQNIDYIRHFPKQYQNIEISLNDLKEYEAQYTTDTAAPDREFFYDSQFRPEGILRQLILSKALPRMVMYEPNEDYIGALGLHLAARRRLHAEQFLIQDGDDDTTFFTSERLMDYFISSFSMYNIDPESTELSLSSSGQDYGTYYSEFTKELRDQYTAAYNWYKNPYN